MKKVIILGAFVLAVTLAFSNPVMAEKIVIVGTGGGMSVLKTVGEAFTQINTKATIGVPASIGSGGGIKSVGGDKDKIGRVGRKIKEKEKHYGLTYVPFAKIPIVFYANESAGITNLTTQQVCDIYSGKITNWKEVGGNDARVRVIRREDSDSSFKVLLESLPGFKDITITPKSKTTLTDQETFKLAEEKPNAIAFGSYTDARNYDVDVLTINGKSATDQDYPYFGELALIFKEKNNSGNIKKFVEFATSSAAYGAIKNAGGIPF